MGINPLKELLAEIENNVKSNQLNNLESIFEKASSVHKESESFLQKFVNNN